MARRRAKQVTEDTPLADETVVDQSADASTDFNPAEFDPALKQQADEIVQSVADATKIPDAEPPANGFAAKHQPPATASGGPGTVRAGTHSETIGKRGPRYNDHGITDKVAGAKLLEHHDPYLSIIRFEEKPSDVVRQMLREAGFRWEAQNEEWARPIRYETRQQDRINAERVFEEICERIRSEKGITHNFGGAA